MKLEDQADRSNLPIPLLFHPEFPFIFQIAREKNRVSDTNFNSKHGSHRFRSPIRSPRKLAASVPYI